MTIKVYLKLLTMCDCLAVNLSFTLSSDWWTYIKHEPIKFPAYIPTLFKFYRIPRDFFYHNCMISLMEKTPNLGKLLINANSYTYGNKNLKTTTNRKLLCLTIMVISVTNYSKLFLFSSDKVITVFWSFITNKT